VRSTSPEQEKCVMLNLTDYLHAQGPGRLLDTAELERHLAGFWGSFEGNDAEGMAPEKLFGRMEQVRWSPPVLTFVIERHGQTCLGSTRADLHRWTINFIEKTATCEKVGHRQMRPMARRLSIQPLAEEVASKIVQGQGDERLVWEGENTVRVVLSAIFPSGSGFKQTIEGRRKRFKQALIQRLEKSGWHHVGRCLFSNDRHTPGRDLIAGLEGID
jgi:hypothetical protein